METAVSFMVIVSGFVSSNLHYGKQKMGSFRPLDIKLSIIVLGEKRQVVGPLVRSLFSVLRNLTRPQVRNEPNLSPAFKLIGVFSFRVALDDVRQDHGCGNVPSEGNGENPIFPEVGDPGMF